MVVELITKEDLEQFKQELLVEMTTIFTQILSMNPQNDWLKVKEVCELLKVSKGTLNTLRMNGTIPYSKIGGVIYFNRQDIEEILNKNRT
jgi:excisionase family DNA binding protein